MLVLTACVAAGCGGQSYPVAYPEAVKLMQELYPVAAPGGPELAGTKPAYSNELVPGPMEMTVDQKEATPGQEYHIQIVKVWKYSADRRTTVTVQKAETGVMVTVRSEKKLGPELWVRDGVHEMERQTEIRDTLKK
jgi:hypothetical protein